MRPADTSPLIEFPNIPVISAGFRMDYENARFNMIEQQIRTWNVLDTEVLDLLFTVRREEFVPPAYRALAFTDTEVPLNLDGKPTGESMLAPKVEARLLQELAVHRHEMVLEVGAGSGYMAALLASRAQKVLSLEIRPELAAFAAENLRRAGMLNATVVNKNGAVAATAVADARFDVIVLSGAVPFVPPSWLERLNPGGRLAAIVGELPVMTAQIHTRGQGNDFSSRVLFDTVARPLIDFPQKEHFRF